jgi:WD40 repeat protein
MHLLSAHVLGNTSPSDTLRPVQTIALSAGQASSSVSSPVVLALSPAHKAQEEARQELLYKWEGSIRDSSFYKQSKRVMFAWADQLGRPRVELFETATGKHLASLVGLDVKPEREFNLSRAAVAPDGSRVFLCGSNGDGFYAQNIPHRHVAWQSGFSGNEDVPEDVAVSADSKYLLLNLGYTAELRSMKTGEIIRTLLSFSENARVGPGPLAFSPHGKYAAITVTPGGSQSQDTILLWKIPSGKQVRKFYCSTVRQVLFSPDGRHLLTLSVGPKKEEVDKDEANIVRLWDWRTGKLARQFSLSSELGPRMLREVAFTPDGKQLLVSGKQMSVWNVETGQEVRRFPQDKPRYGFGELSPDGRYLLSGTQLWQFATGKLLRTFQDAPRPYYHAPGDEYYVPFRRSDSQTHQPIGG